MAATIIIPQPSIWEQFAQIFSAPRGPVRRSPLALQPFARQLHAEVFMSERTGDWIRVGCDCRLGFDHWHTGH
ncbi:MAG: hypothetical protein FWD85_11370 [Microbacteriaceae bacterium]|nr:hypothetical protein [Microbacteriaceae bacterium]MCL2795892.1 hypothetical protein [Microbacteriaceae bacterium]